MAEYARDHGHEVEGASELILLFRRYVWSLADRRRFAYAFDLEALVTFLVRWELIADDLVAALQGKQLGMDRSEIEPLLATVSP